MGTRSQSSRFGLPFSTERKKKKAVQKWKATGTVPVEEKCDRPKKKKNTGEEETKDSHNGHRKATSQPLVTSKNIWLLMVYFAQVRTHLKADEKKKSFLSGSHQQSNMRFAGTHIDKPEEF